MRYAPCTPRAPPPGPRRGDGGPRSDCARIKTRIIKHARGIADREIALLTGSYGMSRVLPLARPQLDASYSGTMPEGDQARQWLPQQMLPPRSADGVKDASRLFRALPRRAGRFSAEKAQ
jgi:hypothetical protein